MHSEFCEGIRRLGYHHNVRDLWTELCPPESKSICFGDFDPQIEQVLERFHSTLIDRYKSLQQAVSKLGVSGTHRLDAEEFCRLIRREHLVNDRDEALPLFKALCSAPSGKTAVVTGREFEWVHKLFHSTPPPTPSDIRDDSDDVCNDEFAESNHDSEVMAAHDDNLNTELVELEVALPISPAPGRKVAKEPVIDERAQRLAAAVEHLRAAGQARMVLRQKLNGHVRFTSPERAPQKPRSASAGPMQRKKMPRPTFLDGATERAGV